MEKIATESKVRMDRKTHLENSNHDQFRDLKALVRVQRHLNSEPQLTLVESAASVLNKQITRTEWRTLRVLSCQTANNQI
jgi:hypothetical protein